MASAEGTRRAWRPLALLALAVAAGAFLLHEAEQASAASVTVTATFDYRPTAGSTARADAKWTAVRVWDGDLSGGPANQVGFGTADGSGRITLVVDNDDPDDNTCFDPFLTFETVISDIQVRDSGDNPFRVQTGYYRNIVNNCQTTTMNFDLDSPNGSGASWSPVFNSDQDKAWRVFEWAIHGFEYVQLQTGQNIGPVKIGLLPGHATHYHPGWVGGADAGEIHMDFSSSYITSFPEATLHEMGHRVSQDILWAGWGPGSGAHDFCLNPLDRGIAWDEAFADFFAVHVWNRRVNSADTTYDNGGNSWNLETPGTCAQGGDDTQIRVGAFLWDLTDSANDGGDDPYGFSFATLWNAMDGCRQTSLLDFYDHTRETISGGGSCSWSSDGNSRAAVLALARKNQVYRTTADDYNLRPVAYVDAPQSQTWTNANSLSISAQTDNHPSAQDPDCPDACAVAVEFFAFYDNAWNSLGTDTTPSTWTRFMDVGGFPTGTVLQFTARSDDGTKKSFDAPDVTVRIDRLAPTTATSVSCTFAGAWCLTVPTVTLTCSDAHSGCSTTQVRVGDGFWDEYTGPFAIPAQGTHVVQYQSYDWAGSIEATGSLTVRHDATAPTTAAAFNGGAPAAWYSGTVTVALSCTDAHSGCATTSFTVDGGAEQAYAGPFQVSTQGTHTVCRRSVDVATNAEASSCTTFGIDLGNPTVAIDTPLAGWVTVDDAPVVEHGNAALPTTAIVVGAVTVQATVGDALSGVVQVRFLVDGVQRASTVPSGATATWVWSGCSVAELGSHMLSVVAVDAAGRTATATRPVVREPCSV